MSKRAKHVVPVGERPRCRFCSCTLRPYTVTRWVADFDTVSQEAPKADWVKVEEAPWANEQYRFQVEYHKRNEDGKLMYGSRGDGEFCRPECGYLWALSVVRQLKNGKYHLVRSDGQ